MTVETDLIAFLDKLHAARDDKETPLRVVVPAAGSQPDLTRMIVYANRWGGLHILGMHYTRDYSEMALAWLERGVDVRFFSPFMSHGDRAMKKAGVLDVFDRPFGRVGMHYAAMKPHAIITETTLPLESVVTGAPFRVSMGASADYTLGLIRTTDIPLLILPNGSQPWLKGNEFPLSRVAGIDWSIPIDGRPVYSAGGKPAATDPVTTAIADNVLEIMAGFPYGLPYQFGVGEIPNSIIARAPEGKIGSFSTEVLTAAMRGFFGMMTGTLVLGDADLLEWVDGNPSAFLREVEYTNHEAPSLMDVVSVNQAMAITLDGAPIVGVGKWYSGVGGSADFATNPTGTRILVLRATHKGESTILLNSDHRWRQFSAAAAHHPDYVVTEYGWRNLNPHRRADGTWFYGTSREIAEALTEIAAPEHRDGLRKAIP